ncbi:DNA sulfur modification protein DndB [Solibacillus daqui]|uniref:DNA sulfur modification protein DndB n=1 Tax=Solibacillus daqui TaxID=2912187 RepID=UPI002366B59E|nr:DNA sulfur modification protein DndB [Solibacillus daqui]
MTQHLAIYTIHEIAQQIEQQTIILRKTEARHTRKIRQYVMEQFVTGDVFIPPIVATENNGVLYIIDGSSRLRSMVDILPMANRMLLSEDIEEQKKAAQLCASIGDIKLAFQVFHDFTEEQQDQLYLDANTKGKKVALSKRIAYDSRNTINTVTNELLLQHEALRFAGIEQEKVSINRPANKNFLSLSQLRAIVSLFLVGKEIESGVHTQQVDQVLIEQRMPILNAWLDELFILESPDKIGDYNISILASFLFVRGLAYYALKGEQFIGQAKKTDYVRNRMKALNHVSWESRQSLWHRFDGRYRGPSGLYFVTNNKKTLAAIINWLCNEGGDVVLKK